LIGLFLIEGRIATGNTYLLPIEREKRRQFPIHPAHKKGGFKGRWNPPCYLHGQKELAGAVLFSQRDPDNRSTSSMEQTLETTEGFFHPHFENFDDEEAPARQMKAAESKKNSGAQG